MAPTNVRAVPLSPVAPSRTAPPNRHLTPAPSPAPPSSPPSQSPSHLSSLLSPSLVTFASSNTGLLLVCLSQLFFTFMNITVKFFLSVSPISTFTLILVRMLITALGCVSYLTLSGDPNPFLGPPDMRPMLFARGFFGFFGLFSNYQSYRGLSVSDSQTIQFLSPSFTALLGFLYLKERLSWRELIGGLVCLVGVMFVSRPPFIFGGAGKEGMPLEEGPVPFPDEGEDAGVQTSARMIGVAWALVSVCSGSIAYITIRAIGDRAHALHSMAYFSYLCTIVCAIGLIIIPEPFVFVSNLRDFGLILAIGVFGFIAQMLLTMGLQREKAGRASMAMYLSLFYSLILEFFIFHTIPPALSFLGAGIILCSAVWVAVNRPSQPTASDEESLPFSRSPSPIPPPGQGQTRRGELYSYSAVPTDPVADEGHEERLGAEDGLKSEGEGRENGDREWLLPDGKRDSIRIPSVNSRPDGKGNAIADVAEKTVENKRRGSNGSTTIIDINGRLNVGRGTTGGGRSSDASASSRGGEGD